MQPDPLAALICYSVQESGKSFLEVDRLLQDQDQLEEIKKWDT